jgi:hypothetical protein
VPSSYLGCQIGDNNQEALNEFGRSLEEARIDALAALTTLDTAIAELSASPLNASLTIGDVGLDNQITWTAVTAGDDGNNERIFYDYQGPLVNPLSPTGFDPRPPTSYVDSSGIIHCVLAVAATGQVDPAFSVTACLPIWISDPGVQARVTGAVVGVGAGLPQPTGVLRLGGGRSSVLPDAEAGANDIAKVFGKQSYTTFLRSLGVPTMETTADASAYVESIDEETVVVNGKVFVVSGTNLVGINALYLALQSNVTDLKKKLTLVNATTKMPYLLSTENVSVTTYDFVCNVPQPVVSVMETPRTWDTRVTVTAQKYTGGNGSALNHYIFWSSSADPSAASQQKLVQLGLPAEYWPGILLGTTPEGNFSDLSVTVPSVYTVEDPELLTKLKLTDAEITELLDKQIAGVKLPSEVTVPALSLQIAKITGNTKSRLSNGLKHSVKAPIAASQTLNLRKSFNDTSRLQEMAIRGRACARLPAFNPNAASGSLPDLPTTSLPNFAKQLEGLFAALSSAVNRALDVFDFLFDAVKSVINGLLNKLQNLGSLADNLFGNALVKCLLGAGGAATGVPDPAAVGPSGSWGGSGGTSSGAMPSIGGIPIPMDLFAKLLQKLSAKIEETVSSAFTAVMKAIQVPLCLAMGVLTAMLSVDLGSLTAPCKDAINPNNKCPPEDVQTVINESQNMSSITSSMPQMEGVPTTSTTSATTEKVQAFTGQTQQTVSTTQQSVSRGIKQIVDEISQSLATKLEFVDKVIKAVRALTGEMTEQKLTSDEASSSSTKCIPPSVGMFNDQVVNTML